MLRFGRLPRSDHTAKADIAQRKRELARLRAELEAAQNVAGEEAAHYLSLINPAADAPESNNRRARPQPRVRSPSPAGTMEDHLDATHAPSRQAPALFSPVWTALEGGAAVRAAKRLAIVEAELGIEKTDPTADATPAEASTRPTTLLGTEAAKLRYHRNRTIEQHVSEETVESGVKGTDEFAKPTGGSPVRRWSKVFPGLNHSFRKPM